MVAAVSNSLNRERISGGPSCALDLVLIGGDVLIGIDALGLVVLRPGAVAA
jgi:hypothetical protein